MTKLNGALEAIVLGGPMQEENSAERVSKHCETYNLGEVITLDYTMAPPLNRRWDSSILWIIDDWSVE